MEKAIPRSEYPRPQLVREAWLCLNGEWDFEIDDGMSGKARGFEKRRSFDGKITVPFCPESILSGVQHIDFMRCVWYGKKLEVPDSWRNDGKRILLHFGAVDYRATVYVNGTEVVRHDGGYTPFCADITDALTQDDNYLVVCAEDDVRAGTQPSGKQSARYHSYGCYYTRTTGIWQTVFLEAADPARVQNIHFMSDIEAGTVLAQIDVTGDAIGASLTLKTRFHGAETGSSTVKITGARAFLTVKLSELVLWDLGKGNLYDAELVIEKDGRVLDRVESYFGMRSVALSKNAFLLNGRKVFGRWVLDQGFYPDGIYTAPTDEALKNDIVSAMKLGFNGARLHQKVFEPRFLYWADVLGYMVWGEQGNWGLNVSDPAAVIRFLPEWLEAVARDDAHPSIIGWCPFNETWNAANGAYQCDDVLRTVYLATKAVDPTRPCIDTSGNYHVITDIFDVHDYEQDPEKFKDNYKDVKNGVVRDQVYRMTPKRQTYRGEPIFVSEYGGIRRNDGDEGWGYGNTPKDDKEFLERYRLLTDALLDNDAMLGFCYTQLYDVEQEKNGLMTYERQFKFDPEIIRRINARKAAIED